jgi:hypothetical protein
MNFRTRTTEKFLTSCKSIRYSNKTQSYHFTYGILQGKADHCCRHVCVGVCMSTLTTSEPMDLGMDIIPTEATQLRILKVYPIMSRPDRLLGPASLLTKGYGRLFPRGYSGRCVKLTTHLLLPTSRMCGAIPPPPQNVSMVWCLVKHRDNFIFTFTLVHHQ